MFKSSNAGHPSIPQNTTAPAPGFEEVERTAEPDDFLAFEREIADEARRLTAEKFPGIPAGTINEGIRYQVRQRRIRLQREDARHLARELED